MKTFLGVGFVAGIGFMTLLAIVASVRGDPHMNDLSEGNLLTQIVLIWGYISALGLWIWMLADFFQRGPSTNRVAWGFCFLFLSFFTAIAYFFSHYLPRSRGEQQTR